MGILRHMLVAQNMRISEMHNARSKYFMGHMSFGRQNLRKFISNRRKPPSTCMEPSIIFLV
jgi:hypothetical protein